MAQFQDGNISANFPQDATNPMNSHTNINMWDRFLVGIDFCVMLQASNPSNVSS